jgi:hypothetical protein
VFAGDWTYDNIGQNETFEVCKDTFGGYEQYHEYASSAALCVEGERSAACKSFLPTHANSTIDGCAGQSMLRGLRATILLVPPTT